MAKNGFWGTVGNIIWFIFGGAIMGLAWALLGVIFCITIIGIPVGKQLFKFAGLSLFPFGKTVDTNFGKHSILNVLWAIFFGWEMMLSAGLCGILYCITIIGIPFGKQWFKLAIAYIFPFGAVIR
ncbi:MAG: YccF domain-containing protein [Clostridia bacterium]